MLKLTKESLKTFLLLFLMASSLILLGIRWNQQAQGIPFQSVLSQIFNTDSKPQKMDVNTIKSGYFAPESIIVSVSRTASLFKLDQDDTYFKSIWNDAKSNYIPSIIKQKPNKVIPLEQWIDIISERSCIRIDFSVNWPSDAIFWIEDTYPGDFKDFNSIRSIAILPEKDVNQTVNTVYINDEKQVYQYQVNIKENFLPKKFYSELFDKLDFQNKPELNILSVKFDLFDSGRDIFISLSNDWNTTYPTVKIEIPPEIELTRSNIENVQNSILLNQKDSFMPKYNEDKGKALFTDTENLYEFYDNGLLDYRYLPDISDNAGKLSAALSQALSFIELRKGLLGDAQLILTDIIPSSNYYELRFNYSYNGVPVYFKGSDTDARMTAPLVIKANSERILACQWVIRSMTEVKGSEKYNLYFYNLIEKQIPSLYPEILEKSVGETFYFDRIEPAYAFGLKDNGDLPSKPQWIISTKTRDYFIPLPGKED